MPRQYPPEFRRKVLDLVASGRPSAAVAADLGISDQTIYAWRRQHRIDTGQMPGLTSGEAAELVAARKRIAELEAELAIHRRSSALLAKVVHPRAVRGHLRDVQRGTAGPSRGPGPGRVRVGLLRLAAPPAVPAGVALCLAGRADRCRPRGLARHLRGPPGPRRPRSGLGAGRHLPRGGGAAHPSGWPQGPAGESPARLKHQGPTAVDRVDRVFARMSVDQLWVTDMTEHPTREGKVYCAAVLEPFLAGLSGGPSTRPRPRLCDQRLGHGPAQPDPAARQRSGDPLRSRGPGWTQGVVATPRV